MESKREIGVREVKDSEMDLQKAIRKANQVLN